MTTNMIGTLITIVVGVAAFLAALPFVVFFTVKLGAFGYLSGKRAFEQHYQGVDSHGKKDETPT
jgi:hypothetical protein